MNSRLKEILSQVYELEGLLLLVENHNDNTDSFVYELIQKKSENINQLTKALPSAMFDEVLEGIKSSDQTEKSIIPEIKEEESIDTSEVKIQEKAEAVEETEEKDDVPESETDNFLKELNEVKPFEGEKLEEEQNDDFVAERETEVNDSIEDSEQTETANDTPEEETEDNDSAETDDFKDLDFETVKTEEPVENENISFIDNSSESDYIDVAPEPSEEKSAEEDENKNADDPDSDILEDDNFEIEEDSDDEYDDFDDLDYVDEDESDSVIRVGDVLQQNLSKNLKKAFTLNDRFRFRRELFENSEIQMTNTLNMVEAMHSMAEAEDYFYNDLEWDKESPEVKEFMLIIKNHFS